MHRCGCARGPGLLPWGAPHGRAPGPSAKTGGLGRAVHGHRPPRETPRSPGVSRRGPRGGHSASRSHGGRPREVLVRQGSRGIPPGGLTGDVTPRGGVTEVCGAVRRPAGRRSPRTPARTVRGTVSAASPAGGAGAAPSSGGAAEDGRGRYSSVPGGAPASSRPLGRTRGPVPVGGAAGRRPPAGPRERPAPDRRMPDRSPGRPSRPRPGGGTSPRQETAAGTRWSSPGALSVAASTERGSMTLS